jgi:4-amino-4-deoxy-L-arabinose transferase-like glycosyltransferase
MLRATSFAASHLLALAGLAVVFWATGLLVARATGLQRRSDTTGLLPVTIGITVWIYALFLLGTVGLLRAWVVASGVAFVLAAAGWYLLLTGSVLPNPFSTPASTARVATRAQLVLFAAPAVVLIAVLVQSLGPAPGWDAGAYHLAVPKHWIQHGGFIRIPYNVFSNWPLNVELLFALALLVQDHVLAKLVHFMFLVLLAIALYRFTARHASATAGAAAVAFLLANPTLVSEARLAYIDVAFAYFAFIAFVYLIDYIDTGSRSALVLSAICCGVAAGAKLSGLFVAISLLPVLWANAGPNIRSRWRRAAIDTLVLGGITMVLALPWYLKSYFYTGNPIYPMLFGVFGGIEWTRDLHDRFVAWQWSIGEGRHTLDYLLLPIRVIGGSSGLQGTVTSAWFVLLPMSIGACLLSATARRCLGVAGVYFVLWALTPQNVRYLIPILPHCAAAAAKGLAVTVSRAERWPSLQSSGGVRIARLVALLLLVVGPQLWLLYVSRATLRGGGSDLRTLQRTAGTVPLTVLPRAYRFVNGRLPPDSRLMLLNTNQGFFLKREYVSDSFFQASQMNALLLENPSTHGVRAVMDRLNVTHVLLWSRGWGIPYPQALWDFLGDASTARLVHRSNDADGYTYYVFELL